MAMEILQQLYFLDILYSKSERQVHAYFNYIFFKYLDDLTPKEVCQKKVQSLVDFRSYHIHLITK